MKYSFVLPAYKARFFKEALDSILSQTYKDFELIIVNDASPEDLYSVVKSYNDPRIRYYVNDQNIGGKDLVAQWNHCLEYAIGEYIILASDDDVYHVEYLEKMDELVCKYPDVNVFRPRVQKIDGHGEIIQIEQFSPEISTQLEFMYNWFAAFIFSGIPYYILKKEALLEMGGYINFPKAWFSDDATIISLSKNGVVTAPQLLFSFRISNENISGRVNNRELLCDKVKSTSLFYEWFSSIIVDIKPMDDISAFYKRHIQSKILIRGVDHYRYLIDTSSKKAIFCSLKYLKEILRFPVKYAIKALIR